MMFSFSDQSGHCLCLTSTWAQQVMLTLAFSTQPGCMRAKCCLTSVINLGTACVQLCTAFDSLIHFQVRVRRPLLLDRPQGVHLRVLPAAAGMAAAEEPDHPGRVRGAALRQVPLLPLPTELPQ